MDQTAPADQGFLRHQRERGEDPIWIAYRCTCWWRSRKRLGLEASLYQILQILSLTLFEKTHFMRLQSVDLDSNFTENANQLILSTFNRTAVSSF